MSRSALAPTSLRDGSSLMSQPSPRALLSSATCHQWAHRQLLLVGWDGSGAQLTWQESLWRFQGHILHVVWFVSSFSSTGVAWDLLWIYTRMNFIWQIKKKKQKKKPRSICAKTERNVNTSITWGRSSKVMMEKIKELLFLAGNSWELVS